MSTLSKEPQLFLFFQIVVDQTVSSTFERIVCSIRPHRVIAAIYREENIGDVFNIQSTLCKISLACRFCCQSERIINIRLHGVDQVKLNHLETANRRTHVELHQKFALRVIHDHVVRAPLSCPHVQRRFDNGLTFTGTSNSQHHRINRRCIHQIGAARPLRLIRRKLPVAIDQISNRLIALQFITILIARIVRNQRGIIELPHTLDIRKATSRIQGIHEVDINHRLLLIQNIVVLIPKDLALIQKDIAVIIQNILRHTPRHLHRVKALIADRTVRNHRRKLYV